MPTRRRPSKKSSKSVVPKAKASAAVKSKSPKATPKPARPAKKAARSVGPKAKPTKPVAKPTMKTAKAPAKPTVGAPSRASKAGKPRPKPRKAKRRGASVAGAERAAVMASIADMLEAAVAANASVIEAEAGPLGATASVADASEVVVESVPIEEPSMRHVGTLYSRHLGIDVAYAWYGSCGAPVVLFPTSGGNHLENEDRGLVDALMPKIAAGAIQAVCVESINRDSWQRKDLHAAERLRRHDLWDAFLADEFLPFVRAMAPAGKLTVYGASMGGYHAVNVAARHPDLVDRCIAFSGLFDVHRLLDGDPFWNDLCYYHSPEAFIPNMDAEWTAKLSRVEWVIATGEHDSLVDESRRLISIFSDKGVPATGEIWPGVFGHDWPFWREHLPRFV